MMGRDFTVKSRLSRAGGSASGGTRPADLAAPLLTALRSRRTLAVSLLSFSSGLPLGLVWYAIPDWMRDIGVDIRVVGLITLAQAPWTFKVVWAPLMDRYVPPFWGRRRGWMALTQLALAVLMLLLAGVGERPETVWVVGALALAIATASASQDIVIDAYAVDVLTREEQGAVVGPRLAVYRAAMVVSGGATITLAAYLGWPAVNAMLAVMFVLMVALTWKSPEPDVQPPPPQSLRDAVWLPLLGVLRRHRALEILAFVVLYKFADQLTQSLTRPFLVDMGYSADHRGIVLASVTVVATIAGAFIGGFVTTLVGLGHALWIFGGLQIFSNAGYFLLSILGQPNLAAMYAATSFELFSSGLGTGAFGVLLMRLTQKRFSATQYALFSSLFALPRVVAGPLTGYAVSAVGWPAFFLSTMVLGVPGLVMLARFVPPGVREPDLDADDSATTVAPVPAAVVLRGIAAAMLLMVVLGAVVALGSAASTPAAGGASVTWAEAFAAVWRPAAVGDWVELLGIVACAVAGGLFIVARYRTAADQGAARGTP
jgi:PAT family beta-lactamase induction signal transducer AmpG